MSESIPQVDPQAEQTRCGFAALIGAPNAGKSTLLNQLAGTKLSIVTHKVQTTRARVRGVVIEGTAQVIFVDTPGIFAPRRRLDEAMVHAAWDGAQDADAVAVIVDAPDHARPSGSKAQEDTARIIEGLKGGARQAILVLNKIDAMAREELLALTARMQDEGVFSDTFMISALTGDGVADLRAHVAAQMPAGPWHYPEDQVSDLTDRLLAAEITREKLILRLHDELPYDTTVETDSWKSLKDGSVRVEQIVYVARDGQKAIVLGKQGQTIKAIGQAAREELETLMETKVHLFLHVKTRKNWAEEAGRLRAIGLEPPK